jgi:ADP-ribosyl-[dinitrogen reductase] hydrolase
MSSRVRGAMLGLVVGDALGAPLEGASPAHASAVAAGGLDMTGDDCWAPGEGTDDTALMLALAESIGARGLLDADDVAGRYIGWANADGKGIGRTTRHALIGARDAADARARARERHRVAPSAAGNGTVMRATPIGLAAHDLTEAVAAARCDAQITHAAPVAGAASAALCAALLALRTAADPLDAAREQARDHPPLMEALGAAARADEAKLAQLAGGPAAGSPWTALSVALFALVAIDDYERAVTWTIALGGDADTNAAVTGALLGCRHGVGAIPSRWLSALRERARIERAARGLVLHVAR